MLMRPFKLQRGSTFVGILIGLILGLAIALAVAWYINKLPNPFSKVPQAPLPPKAQVSTPKPVASPEPAKAADSTTAEKPKAADTPPAEKPKADTSTEAKDAEKKSTGKGQDTFFIQAGSFQNSSDADNMKARLALMGMEATVQTRDLGDKGVWYRVRVGPYRDVEELNQVRGALKQNGIESALVKVRESDK